MTIDEEIERFEKLASDYEFNLDMHQRNVMKLSVNDIERMKRNAQENRQRAEWLKELKKWRALRDSINMLCDVDCEYPQYRESGTMCDACPVGTVKEYFEQIFDGEVNTDEEGGESE